MHQKINRVGARPRRVKWRWMLTRLCLAIVLAWMLLISSLAFTSTWKLLHPACLQPGNPPTGSHEVEIDISKSGSKAWWISSQNGAAVILIPGYGSGRDSMRLEGEFLARHGYGVLMLDGHQCEGKQVSLGYLEVDDLRWAVNFLKNQPGIHHIGVLGFSAGGVTAILGATQLPEIEAVISEGNYSSLSQEITSQPAIVLSMEWQIQRMVLLDYWVITGVPPWKANPIEVLPLISPRPVLLIFGDQEIDRTQGNLQYAAALPPKELWVVNGSDHGGYRQAAPVEYDRRLINFFDHWLLGIVQE